MLKQLRTIINELHVFLVLWSTQSLSALGSSMTNFALVVWSYQQTGSALTTSLLSICSYAPYVLLSMFAGALSDKWDKKVTMLVSDSFAALSTIAVLGLLKTGHLEIWHLYFLNAMNGLMNTIQQPASDVAVSLLTPRKHYQKVSGMRSFSNSLVTLLTPILATALLSFTSLETVIFVDLSTFVVAFVSLLFFIRIPAVRKDETATQEKLLVSVKRGLDYLKENRGILDLILFLAAINLTASIYNAALPAMLLSRAGGGEMVLGTVLGWICIPVMSANLDVILRSHIPVEMQGRVYSARNTLQFFTIPVGYLLGGILVDRVFEPFMAVYAEGSLLGTLFGTGKGSGAALLFLFIGVLGVMTCLLFRKDQNLWRLERTE